MTINKDINKNTIFHNGYINTDNQNLNCFDSWLLETYGKYEDDLIINKYLRGLKSAEIVNYLEFLKQEYLESTEKPCFDKIYNNDYADLALSDDETDNENYKYNI